jgi:hypothetical protein
MPELGFPFFWLIMFLIMAGSSVSASAGFGFGIILVGALQFFMPTVELVGVITTLGCVWAGLRVKKPGKYRVGDNHYTFYAYPVEFRCLNCSYSNGFFKLVRPRSVYNAAIVRMFGIHKHVDVI